MVQIRQAVNHRDRGIFGPFFHHLVFIGANNQSIQVTRQHTRRVGNTFSTPHLDIRNRKKQGLAAELVHSGLERYAGAGGGLFEI